MELVTEFAGGSFEQWDKRSWAERRAWVYFRVLQNEKKRRHEQRMVEEAEHQRKVQESMPKTYSDRPGVRN